MSTNGLYIFVEGADDQRLIEQVCNAHLSKRYTWIKAYQYAQRKPKQVCAFIRSIVTMGYDYIFFGDADLNPVAEKKQKLHRTYVDLNESAIQIVVQEIESWYLAGLDSDAYENLGLNKKFRDTELINKEKFNALMPAKFSSRIDFMAEIVKVFSLESAIAANNSFAYFARTKIERPLCN